MRFLSRCVNAYSWMLLSEHFFCAESLWSVLCRHMRHMLTQRIPRLSTNTGSETCKVLVNFLRVLKNPHLNMIVLDVDSNHAKTNQYNSRMLLSERRELRI
jgi:hypothetical protein